MIAIFTGLCGLAAGFFGLTLLLRAARIRDKRFWAVTASVGWLGVGCVLGWEMRDKTATANRAPSIVRSQPSTANRASFAVYRQPSLLGSSIKDVYHLSTCRYAALMEHAVEYDSHDQARADGKAPCKICLPGQQ